MDLQITKKLLKPALFTLLALFMSTSFALAQEAEKPMEDVVYLKNGWILRGTILEMVPDSSVTIKTWARNVFVFEMKEVQKIAKEERPVRKRPTTSPGVNYPRYVRKMKPKKPTQFKEPGYSAAVDAGFLFGRNSWGAPSIRTTIQTTHGYKFFPQLTVSGGIGVDSYNFNTFNDFNFTTLNATIVPVFVELRGDLLKESKATPFYYAQAGNGFSWLVDKGAFDSYQGGLYSHFGFGFHFYSGGKLSYTVDMGYKMQFFNASWREFDPWGNPDPIQVSQSGSMRRVVLKTGIMF